jgi:hypothetical protein
MGLPATSVNEPPERWLGPLEQAIADRLERIRAQAVLRSPRLGLAPPPVATAPATPATRLLRPGLRVEKQRRGYTIYDPVPAARPQAARPALHHQPTGQPRPADRHQPASGSVRHRPSAARQTPSWYLPQQ